jgi:hypothetical protein
VSTPSPQVRQVLALPKAGRRAAFEELVIAEFTEILDLPEGGEFPRRTGFFDLGMTSLRLTEVRQRLTRLLGDQVRIETLFDHATMDGLLEHLVTTVLPELARDTTEAAPLDPPAQLEELLERLYR